MRPASRSKFGPYDGSIRIRFYHPEEEETVNGYIVRQFGARSFMVKAFGENQAYRVVLPKNSTEASNSTDFARIQVYDAQDEEFLSVRSFNNKSAILVSGEKVLFNARYALRSHTEYEFGIQISTQHDSGNTSIVIGITQSRLLYPSWMLRVEISENGTDGWTDLYEELPIFDEVALLIDEEDIGKHLRVTATAMADPTKTVVHGAYEISGPPVEPFFDATMPEEVTSGVLTQFPLTIGGDIPEGTTIRAVLATDPGGLYGTWTDQVPYTSGMTEVGFNIHGSYDGRYLKLALFNNGSYSIYTTDYSLVV